LDAVIDIAIDRADEVDRKKEFDQKAVGLRSYP